MLRNALGALGGVLLVAVIGPLTGCQVEQLRQENEQLWMQNDELQAELTRARLALDAAESDRNGLVDQLETLRNTKASVSANTGFSRIQGVETIQGAGVVTVRVPGDVLFAPGKTSLRGSAQKTLNQIAGVINREYQSNTVRVKGFTDKDPIKKSKWTDNLELSLQRAAAVHRYLQKKGVAPAKLQAVGLGQWHPRGSKAKSRRVEIEVYLSN